MRVIFASPTYGPVDPYCASTQRTAIMQAARHGTEWMGSFSPDRMAYGAARNHVVEGVNLMEEPPDGIVWMDSDIVPEVNSIWKMLAQVEHYGHEFHSGLYHQRKGEHAPLFYKYIPERDTFRQGSGYNPGIIMQADGCGFGFVYTSYLLLKAIEALPTFDPDQGAWFPDRREGYGKFGEDLGFCRHALDTGLQLWVDTGNIVGHMGDAEVIGREQFVAAIAAKGALVEVI